MNDVKVDTARQQMLEIQAYFAEWREEIDRAERALNQQKIEYANCLRDYQACRNIVGKRNAPPSP